MSTYHICAECSYCNAYQTQNDVPTCYNASMLRRYGIDLVTGVQKFYKKPCSEVRGSYKTCEGFERRYVPLGGDMYE